MIIVCISVSGEADRFATLPMGTSVVGSNFDCDVVLIDEGVSGRHLEFLVQEEGVQVKTLDDAGAILKTPFGKRTAMAPSQSYDWVAANRVECGPVSITLSGDSLSLLPAGPSPIAHIGQRIVNRVGAAASMAIVGVGTIVALGTLMLVLVSASSAQPIVVPRDKTSGASNALTNQMELPTAEAVRSDLEQDGFNVHEVTKQSDQTFQAVFYLETPQDDVQLRAHLAELSYDVRPQRYFDSSILSAVNIIVRSTDSDAAVEGVRKGVISLSGLKSDPVGRARLATMIKNDVPGTLAVEFVDTAMTPADDFVAEISGIWRGPRPYIALKSGRVIAVGDEFGDGVRLRAITPHGVVMEDQNGDKQQVELK